MYKELCDRGLRTCSYIKQSMTMRYEIPKSLHFFTRSKM